VLLAARLDAMHVEIWTDVPGLFSADPRLIPGARLLPSLDYDEALEMAASGAKVVHSRSIRAAADAGIQVRIGHLGQSNTTGTTIQDHEQMPDLRAEGIRCVCCQPEMAVLLLQNLDMREQVGFLAWVFTQISDAGISIDLVATSETTTTLYPHCGNDVRSPFTPNAAPSTWLAVVPVLRSPKLTPGRNFLPNAPY
jgi:diaminopimelate decarboxylase/aspartate kinase